MDEHSRSIVEEAFATLDRTRHVAPKTPTYDLPLEDFSAYPTGVDRVQFRQEQQRKARQDAQRNAAHARDDMSELDARVRAEIMAALDSGGVLHDVITTFVSDYVYPLRQQISGLRGEIASLREGRGSVTVLPPKGKNASR